jgi:hypothetical protein
LGPDGHQLALDHYGRLVCVRDGRLLTGEGHEGCEGGESREGCG